MAQHVDHIELEDRGRSYQSLDSTDSKRERTLRAESASNIGHSTSLPVSTHEAFFCDGYFTGEQRKNSVLERLQSFGGRDLKILLKASIAVWINTLLFLINPTLHAIGQATFFGCIILFIVPASSIVFIHVLAGVTIIIGICIGWAIGVITMKLALTVRSTDETNARLAELVQSIPSDLANAQSSETQKGFIQLSILKGHMLDARITAIYFCLLVTCIYFISRLRIRAPKIVLIQIFVIVVADIYLVIAPLIPAFEGTLALTMVLPAAVAVGIGLVCNILIFPESTSSTVVHDTCSMLQHMQQYLSVFALNMRHPQARIKLEKLEMLEKDLMTLDAEIEGAMSFLPLDVVIGKWSAYDLESIKAPLRVVLIAVHELMRLHTIKQKYENGDRMALKNVDQIWRAIIQRKQQAVDTDEEDKFLAPDERCNEQNFEATSSPTPIKFSRTGPFQSSFKALAEPTETIIEQCMKCFTAVDATLKKTRNTNWFRSVPENDYENNLPNLISLVDNMKEHEALIVGQTMNALLNTHSHLSNADEQIVKQPQDRLLQRGGLLIGILLQDRLLALSQSLRKMVETIVQIESQRKKVQLWGPRSFRNFRKWAMERQSVEGSEFKQTLPRTSIGCSTRTQPQGTAQSTLPTAREQLEQMKDPQSRKRTGCAQLLLVVLGWLFNDEGIYALRMVIVTVALAIPAVIPSSAWFYYREKALWALIMAQTGLAPYTSDLVFGAITRIGGTVLGGVLGLACWYIGAGTGPGNPYGMAAIMALAIVLMMACRLWLPTMLLQGTIMMIATTYLVVAFSWTDARNPSHGSPGVGYSIFWRRILLVMIGFFAAIIVTFLPRPPSASRHYRELLATCLDSIKDRYVLYSQNWEYPASDYNTVVEAEQLRVAETLTSAAEPIRLTKFEFSSSSINTSTLISTCLEIRELNHDISQLSTYTTSLPSALQTKFMFVTGATDPVFMAELIGTITLVQYSLRTGQPLPMIMSTPFLEKVVLKINNRMAQSREPDMNLEEQLAQEHTRTFIIAISVFIHFLSTIDNLVALVKRDVGQSSSYI